MNNYVAKFNLCVAVSVTLITALLTPQRVKQMLPDLTSTNISTKNAAMFAISSAISSQITLVGQLIPAVNTGSDAGLGGDMNNDPRIVASQPIEYHLYDAKNNSIKLSFDNENLYQLAWQKWLNAQPNKNELLAGAAQVPDISANYPKYALYRELWQDWVGKWISVKGVITQTNTLKVNALEVASAISENFIEQLSSTLSTITVQSPVPLGRAQQIIFEGCIRIADSNPLPRPGHMGYVGPLTYYLTDNQGKKRELIIYDSGQPNNETRMILLDGSFTRYFGDLQAKCAQFTGWLFNPPRWDSKSDVIEVQLIQEILRTNMSTPSLSTSTTSS